MSIKTEEHKACSTCADIVTFGYDEQFCLDHPEEHKARVNAIDASLPAGHYWLEQRETDADEFYASCGFCGIGCAQDTVYSASKA